MKRNPYRAAFAAMAVSLLVACSQGGAPVPGASAAADPKAAAQTTLDGAMQADRDFAAATLKDGPLKAFPPHLAPGILFLEPGIAIDNAAEVLSMFERTPPGFTMEWTPDGGTASVGGDMAVTTGRFVNKVETAELNKGRYLAVWRKDDAGAWKIIYFTPVSDPASVTPTTPAPERPDLEGRPG
jgi:ketosteroid isomerase-like protein